MKVYIILKLPHVSTENLQSQLSRLELKLDVWIIDQHHQGTSNDSSGADGQTRQLVHSHTVDREQDPVVIVVDDDDDDADQAVKSGHGSGLSTLIVWEARVTIDRPKLRLNDPHTVMVVSANVKEPAKLQPGEEYLPSFQPRPSNVLDAMRNVPGIGSNPPYLSSAHFDRSKAINDALKPALRLPQTTRLAMKTISAVTTRLKPARPIVPNYKGELIVSLEVEVPVVPEIKCLVEEVRLSFVDGAAEPIFAGDLPLSCVSGEVVVFLFKLHSFRPNKSVFQIPLAGDDGPVPSSIGIISTSLLLQVILQNGSSATIKMHWTTNIDLSSISGETYQGTESSFQIPGQFSTSRPTTAGSDQKRSQGPSSRHNSVVCTFTAPERPAKIGQPFQWHLHVYNGTSQTARMAVVPLPRLQRAASSSLMSNSHRYHETSMSVVSQSSSTRRGDGGKRVSKSIAATDQAPAIVDENVLYALNHSRARTTDSDLVSLTPELRIGPLVPGATHETDLTMVAFSTGCLKMDCVRIVDLVRESQMAAEEQSNEEGRTQKPSIFDIMSKDLPVTWVEA